MQLIIDTNKDSFTDIGLAIELLKLIASRAPQVSGPEQTELDLNDLLPESKQLEVASTILNAMSKLNEAASDATPPTKSFEEFSESTRGLPVDGTDRSDDTPLPSRLPDVPSQAVDEDTDTAGVKWDATLHSESRNKNADGTWRRRRNAKNVVSSDKGTYGAIAQPQPEITEADVAATTGVPEVPPDRTALRDDAIARLKPYTPAPEAVVVPPPPTTAVVPPPPAAAFTPVTSFRELMEQMTVHMAARNITSKEVNEICREHGIESMQDCFNNTALIPSVHTAIVRVAAAKAGV